NEWTPDAPENFILLASYQTSLSFSWNPAKVKNGSIFEYRLIVHPVERNDLSWSRFFPKGTDIGYTVIDLLPSVTYRCTLYAISYANVMGEPVSLLATTVPSGSLVAFVPTLGVPLCCRAFHEQDAQVLMDGRVLGCLVEAIQSWRIGWRRVKIRSSRISWMPPLFAYKGSPLFDQVLLSCCQDCQTSKEEVF
ncbi:unnamed protein product, partial [Protopolystoma xenopodis]